MAIGISGGRLRCASLGIEPQFSMYAALQPVPNMQPILIAWSVYAEAISVPVVSLIMATRVMGRFWRPG